MSSHSNLLLTIDTQEWRMKKIHKSKSFNGFIVQFNKRIFFFLMKKIMSIVCNLNGHFRDGKTAKKYAIDKMRWAWMKLVNEIY